MLALETRLIFVEGLPGAGKTTTSTYIAERLRRKRLAVETWAEVEPDHPLNVGGALHPAGSTTGAGLFASYTVEAYIDESLQRWRAFAAARSESSTVTVLDSYPYQNSVRILLQMDAALEVIQSYAQQVEAIAGALGPVLIYLTRAITPEALSGTSRMRGDAWTAYAIDVITNCPYARNRQLTGAQGAMDLLAAYNALLRQLLAESTVRRLVLDQCDGRWDACYAQIDAFLG